MQAASFRFEIGSPIPFLVRITVTLRVLLMYGCVSMCVYECVYVCVRESVCLCVCVHACACVYKSEPREERVVLKNVFPLLTDIFFNSLLHVF